MTKRIDRYLFGLIIVPLFGTLVVAAMLLVLDRMLRLFDFVINEGGPVSVVWRMLGNLLPEYLSLGIPIGVMLGILLAFRRLAMSSELDTLLAVGVSYKRLLRVPFVFATVFAVVNFVRAHGVSAEDALRAANAKSIWPRVSTMASCGASAM